MLKIILTGIIILLLVYKTLSPINEDLSEQLKKCEAVVLRLRQHQRLLAADMARE